MKQQLNDLAIFGGVPSFQSPLHVGRPNIGNREQLIARVNDMLDRRWLTNNGPYVQEFERRIAKYVGVKHCAAVCNATIGLEISIRAAGLKGEVIVPSFTFVATAHALQWQEITPIFCDIDPQTHNLDPQKLEKLITARTSGIIGVHVWGRPCAIQELIELSRKYKLKLIFDAAHAFGCSFKGRMIGGFGDAEVFSFHATKFFNTMEGGAVVSNDDELINKIRLMTNFGFSGYDNVIYLGTNGKMNEASAAMGLTNLECINDFIKINTRNYKQYQEELAGIPGIKLVKYDESERNNYQYIVLEVDKKKTHISRDQIADILHHENVLVRRYFYPGCHQMEPYRSYFPHASLLLPETEELVQRTLLLPTGTAVGQDEISGICQLVRLVIGNGSEMSMRLESAKS
jgi:dTDP-4-amino-4,6-dideoxygalactose transaminase